MDFLGIRNRGIRNRFLRYESEWCIGTILVCFIAVGMYCDQAWAQGNKVSFANGGTIAAEVEVGSGAGAQAVVKTPEGVTVVVPAEQIKRHTGMRKEILAYRATAPLLPDTAQAHLTMARKCMEKSLSAEADRHLKHVLVLDPDNEEAHRLLQHVKVNGEWISPKERMEQKGYTRYSGKLLTQQEIELEKKRVEFKQLQSQWRKQIKTMLKDFGMGKIGIDAFRQIKEPGALGPLSEAYEKERNQSVRLALVTAMGSIGSVAALAELGGISLRDEVEEIRLTALDAIKRRPESLTGAVEYYKRFLLSRDNLQVNRAAAMLGVLEAPSAIPALINALVTEHSNTTTVGSDQTGASFSSDGRLQGFSPGGGARKKVVTESIQNEQVLTALRRTVSTHFGPEPGFRFDEEQWKRWYRTVNSVESFSSRRNL